MNILVLCSTFPYPPTKGRQQLRTFHLLEYLAARHQITLVTRPEIATTEVELAQLQTKVAKLVTFSVKETAVDLSLIDKAKRLGKLIQQKTPPDILNSYCPEMAAWINETIAENIFEAIACEDSADEAYICPQWHKQLKVILNLHLSEYGKYKQQLATGNSDNELKDRVNLSLRKRYEQSYLAKFSQIITVTDKDKSIVRRLEPEVSVKAISNGVNLAQFPYRTTEGGEQKIVFVGNMDNPINIDAAIFLAQLVFPAVLQRYPTATLELVGAKPVAEILDLDELPGILVTGKVNSVVEYLHGATVCVIPIRQGYGLRNRTLEAMAAGVPVVGSDRALAEFKVDGADIPLRAMRANTLEEYVYAIGRLFSEPKLRTKLAVNGRSLVEKEYTWERVGEKYEQLLIATKQSIN